PAPLGNDVPCTDADTACAAGSLKKSARPAWMLGKKAPEVGTADDVSTAMNRCAGRVQMKFPGGWQEGSSHWTAGPRLSMLIDQLLVVSHSAIVLPGLTKIASPALTGQGTSTHLPGAIAAFDMQVLVTVPVGGEEGMLLPE